MSEPSALEPDAKAREEMVRHVLGRIQDHLEGLEDAPAMDVGDAEQVADRFVEPLPTKGVDLEHLLNRLFEEAVPASLTTNGPGYLAYIPAGGIFETMLADMIADATNRYIGARQAAPALAQIEQTVVDWFREIVGFPEQGGGILTSGGSLANQTAVTTARIDRLGQDLAGGTIYVSDQVHHSVTKAARLAGFPDDAVRVVATDDRYRLDVDALRSRIREDRGAGDRPFLVVASAGTTNTGAVDPLADLADLCQNEDLWLHVDGAYGGFFALTDRGGDALSGMERADSVTLDPHKSLFVPYGVGSLIVRDRATLQAAHEVDADYLPDDMDAADPHRLGPELTRPFRGLRVWVPMQLHGAATFRQYLDEKLDLARWAADELAALEDVELVDEPQLTVVAFRYAPDGVEGEDLDARNRELLERVNQAKRVHISGTTLDGVFAPRFCVLSFRTHRRHVQAGIDDVRAAVEDLRDRR